MSLRDVAVLAPASFALDGRRLQFARGASYSNWRSRPMFVRPPSSHDEA